MHTRSYRFSEETAVKMEVAPYKGWARALHFSNSDVQLVVTLDVGPRILHYAHRGGPNILKEIPDEMGTAGEAKWLMRGGHRLWASPEDPAYTYFADNDPTTYGIESTFAWIAGSVDPKSGLSYTMRIALAESGGGVRIEHTVANHSFAPVRLAPWALTVFAPGGTAVIPLPPYSPHPGGGGKSAAEYAPQLTLTLWPYFRFSDRRFAFGDRLVRIKQDPTNSSPTKIGACLRNGWAAYQLHGSLFVKRVPYDAHANYPDGGCNFECYTDGNILELETLAGLSHVEPGKTVSHVETWSLHKNVILSADEAEVEKTIEALVLGTPQL